MTKSRTRHALSDKGIPLFSLFLTFSLFFSPHPRTSIVVFILAVFVIPRQVRENEQDSTNVVNPILSGASDGQSSSSSPSYTVGVVI